MDFNADFYLSNKISKILICLICINYFLIIKLINAHFFEFYTTTSNQI